MVVLAAALQPLYNITIILKSVIVIVIRSPGYTDTPVTSARGVRRRAIVEFVTPGFKGLTEQHRNLILYHPHSLVSLVINRREDKCRLISFRNSI